MSIQLCLISPTREKGQWAGLFPKITPENMSEQVPGSHKM
jgi:hypothetical protein